MWEIGLIFLLILPVLGATIAMLMSNRAVAIKDAEYSPEDMRTKSHKGGGISILCLGIYGTLMWIAVAVFMWDGQKSLIAISAVIAPLMTIGGVFLYFMFTKPYEWIEGDVLYYKRLFGKVKEIPLENIASFSYTPGKALAMTLYDSENKSLLLISANRLGKAMLARELEARGKIRIDNPLGFGK